MYIIGLTQYHDHCIQFSDIWPLLNYSPANTNWINPLTNMVNHVSIISGEISKGHEALKDLPTLFVEGLTDVSLFSKVIELHFANVADKFVIRSQKNAGANWVAQQLVIWGHQFKRDCDGDLIRAIGLFDSDTSGIRAKAEVHKKLNSANQEKSVKTMCIVAKHSQNLIEFYKAGLKIEIESLLPIPILKYADSQGWLENRNPPFVEFPKDFDHMGETIPDYLKRKGIRSELGLYLKKVKSTKKDLFCNYVLAESDKTKETLDGIQLLMKEILKDLLSE